MHKLIYRSFKKHWATLNYSPLVGEIMARAHWHLIDIHSLRCARGTRARLTVTAPRSHRRRRRPPTQGNSLYKIQRSCSRLFACFATHAAIVYYRALALCFLSLGVHPLVHIHLYRRRLLCFLCLCGCGSVPMRETHEMHFAFLLFWSRHINKFIKPLRSLLTPLPIYVRRDKREFSTNRCNFKKLQ